MPHRVSITVAPHLLHEKDVVKKLANEAAGFTSNSTLRPVTIKKRSIDARRGKVQFVLQCDVYDSGDDGNTTLRIEYKDVQNAPSIVIIGAGPAGLFCALRCIENGIKPIVIDRGKNVRDRRRDLAMLNKEGILNCESNYCFGEGGAGTYSDGKLYTRSGKRGSIEKILNCFVQFGAHEDILIDAHPHIGTNKLPQIISAMRQQIVECGGEVHFETKLLDLEIKNNALVSITTNTGTMPCTSMILATGHSARDIYKLLDSKKILMEAKPLAIGVRVEHHQSFVDSIQYSCDARPLELPPASYSLVQQVGDRGVFSFCMCPGGIIAAASTEQNALVVNGWSPSKRNNAFANSGMVVAVSPVDMKNFAQHGALASMYYQAAIEEKAFAVGGGSYVAPAQRITDFAKNKTSTSLPPCSYVPGVQASHLGNVLPPIILSSLQKGFLAFDKKMKGYIQQDAIVVATESRTSAPVRIPRLVDTCEHIQIQGLYPCGEGAGYAGGILSAAMDGERVADAACKKIKS